MRVASQSVSSPGGCRASHSSARTPGESRSRPSSSPARRIRLRSVCRWTPRRAAAGSHWPCAASQTRSDSTRSPAPARSAATSGASSASAKAAAAAGSSSAPRPRAGEVGERRHRPAAVAAVLGGLPRLPHPVGQPAHAHRRGGADRGAGDPLGQLGQPVGQRPPSATSRTRAVIELGGEHGSRGVRRGVGGDVDRGRRCSALPSTTSTRTGPAGSCSPRAATTGATAASSPASRSRSSAARSAAVALSSAGTARAAG